MSKIAVLVHNDFQDDEYRRPVAALQSAGHEVTIVGPEGQKTYRGKNLREKAVTDVGLDSARPEAFDALVIPGGYAPDKLRLVNGVVPFIRHFHETGKPIAAICHGPQLLISADIVRGRRLTCYDSIVVDVKNAGGVYLNEAVVTDGNLITSRKPADLPHFCDALLQALNAVRPAAAHRS
jgi:protease I